VANYSIHKASELAREERVLVERWLGRPLSEDETVSLNAFRPHAAPGAPDRQGLCREILAHAGEIGSRAPGVTDEEAAALVQEALTAVRGGRG
jgi:hypothetical protein